MLLADVIGLPVRMILGRSHIPVAMIWFTKLFQKTIFIYSLTVMEQKNLSITGNFKNGFKQFKIIAAGGYL